VHALSDPISTNSITGGGIDNHVDHPEASSASFRHLHRWHSTAGFGKWVLGWLGGEFDATLQISGTVVTYVLVALQFHASWAN
jgi:hypothetical protein